MCDGRSLASPSFRRLAGRGVFLGCLPCRWILGLVAFLIRGVALRESSSCSRGDFLGDCGRPCDPLSCLLFTALWLRCCQSKVVQETPSAKDVDLTCSITFLFNDATCLPVGPMSLDWPVNPFGRSDSSTSSLRISRNADCSTRQICWNHDRPAWTPPSLGCCPENFIQRVMKINASTKSLVERLCDIKIYAISVLSFIGSVCAPDKATLKAENHALQCTTAGPYNAITSKLLEVGSICGLGLDLVGIQSISVAARYRVAACSSTLRRGLEKVNEARGHNCTPLFALSPAWEREFLFPSMTFHTAHAFDVVCRLDRDDILDEVPQNKEQNIATGLLLDKQRTQDFAGPLSSRATRVLGPISGHCIADILPHLKRVSPASRPGLLVGFLRILCNGLCTAQRFHTAENDHTCRIGCPDAPDSLSHYNELNVPGCTTSFFLSGGTPRWCHKGTSCCTT